MHYYKFYSYKCAVMLGHGTYEDARNYSVCINEKLPFLVSFDSITFAEAFKLSGCTVDTWEATFIDMSLANAHTYIKSGAYGPDSVVLLPSRAKTTMPTVHDYVTKTRGWQAVAPVRMRLPVDNTQVALKPVTPPPPSVHGSCSVNAAGVVHAYAAGVPIELPAGYFTAKDSPKDGAKETPKIEPEPTYKENTRETAGFSVYLKDLTPTQRAAYFTRALKMTYGEHYVTPASLALGITINQVTNMLDAKEYIPLYIWRELHFIMATKARKLATLANTLNAYGD